MTVALFATVVFVISGAQVLPALAWGNGLARAPSPEQATFLLNIALLLFAWRRSVQLKESVAQRQAAEMKIRHLAYYDELTGLHNRRHLHVVAGELLAKGEKDMALLLLDLDQFKAVNDLHGHEAGDALLVSTGEKIRAFCDPEDCAVRLGGDEFAVLLHGSRARGKRPRVLAEKLVEVLSQPVQVSDTIIGVGASIGIARVQGGSRELRWLLRRADIAMYEAKTAGKNRCVEFDERMEIELGQRAALETEIRHGIMAGEFIPYFQPIVELATGKVKGFEALARWQHPAKGLLEPSAFLDVAEASGLIGEVSLSVMQQALLAARSWPAHLKIAVNVSAVQFKDPLLAQRLLRILTTTNFPARRLELEIPELPDLRSRVRPDQRAEPPGAGHRHRGRRLRHRICLADPSPRVAVRPDQDRPQLREAARDRQAMRRARPGDRHAGEGLSIPLSAEGIETTTIQAKLEALGCADAQGWLFAKALSRDQVHGVLKADGVPQVERPAKAG